ncbi:MarR family winged helix-turn-helix transcriptional regulator [Dactylosporangium sp. CA-233914]|uniref:MarR family winged helix-turn-helix transcriptional regulator n=1 Tax=Dactylosporangium sp. CA-233914 TaxID=3239934 RepID=UPI003D8C91A1
MTDQGTVIQYDLGLNVGYLLRRCSQDNTSRFMEAAPPVLSPPRFAALARLVQFGSVSQNRLGRLISTDAATIKGIVDRLSAAGAVKTSPDPTDKRQRLVSITEYGVELYIKGVIASKSAATQMLDKLSKSEAETFIALLLKVAGSDPAAEVA